MRGLFIFTNSKTITSVFLFHFCIVKFLHAINPTGKTPVFLLNQHIGFDNDKKKADGEVIKGDGWGVNGKSFSREFFEIDSLRPDKIVTFVNSQGGDIEHAYDIFNAIHNANSRTESVIAGFALSSAGWAPLSSDYIKMYNYSTWMCHMPFHVEDEEKASPILNMVVNSVATIIASKSGRNGKAKKTVSEVKEMMMNKTYYSAQEMYDNGLIDEIVNDKDAIFNLGTKPMSVVYVEQQRFLNKFVNDTFNTNNMSHKINNRLGLAIDSSEESQLSAIANLENKISFGEKEIAQLRNQIKTQSESFEIVNREKAELSAKNDTLSSQVSEKDNLINSMKVEMETLKIQNKEFSDKVAENERIANEEKAKFVSDKADQLVEKFVNAGKIEDTDAAKKPWKESAIENFERTEAILNALPTNFHVPVPTSVENTDKGSGSIADRYRIENKQKREERKNQEVDEFKRFN